MTQRSHCCPVRGCEKRIVGNHLMCAKHWYRVPRTIRDQVWSALRRYQRGDATLGELQDAQAKATEAVDALEANT